MAHDRLQMRLGDAERAALDALREVGVGSAEALRAGLVLATEVGSDSPDRLRAIASPDWPFPDWWSPLCRHLRQRQVEGGFVETTSGVRNYILQVDEDLGALVFRSERSRSGGPRSITVSMLRHRDATTHGVLIRALRDLADQLVVAPPGAWVGPFRVETLLADCLRPDQPRPPDHHGVYLVSRTAWSGAPTVACEPLYLGSTTGRSARFRTRVGDLLADLYGFFGETTGHSSGGQKLHRWCSAEGVPPGSLFLGWFAGSAWCGCFERELYEAFRSTTLLNAISPPRCLEHPSGRPIPAAILPPSKVEDAPAVPSVPSVAERDPVEAPHAATEKAAVAMTTPPAAAARAKVPAAPIADVPPAPSARSERPYVPSSPKLAAGASQQAVRQLTGKLRRGVAEITLKNVYGPHAARVLTSLGCIVSKPKKGAKREVFWATDQPLPTRKEYQRAHDRHFTVPLETLLLRAFEELAELASECREAYDTVTGTSLENTERYQTLAATADTLEGLDTPGLPEIVSRLEAVSVPVPARRSSRATRRDRACMDLETALAAIRDYLVESETTGAQPGVGETTPADLEELQSLASETEAAIDAAQSCEFPGMYG
ncbi:MAG: hypothetical protein EPO40_21910 [Myxococcaceae bacterium]|nr:MAG: hypothetical protein EPO40_21910 [Myxococcaceae bacterium]